MPTRPPTRSRSTARVDLGLRRLPTVRVLVDVSAVPDQPVGAGVYTIELVSRLQARDELTLALLSRREDEARWRDLAPRATVHALLPRARPLRLVAEQLRAEAVVPRPDVWHGPHYTMPWWRSPAPAVVTVHDLTFFDHPEWHERTKVAFFTRAIGAATRRAAAIVTPSETTTRRLAELLDVDTEVVTIPHGVDRRRFRPRREADTAEDLRRLAGTGIRPPYVAFAGTLEPRKDVPTLVRAFSVVARQRPDLRLVLAGGDGWGADAVKRAVLDSGAATRIVRPGYLPDAVLPALYRNAEMVVYPSLAEGFGLPALEALACGAPVVTTLGTAMADVVGDAAVLVPPRAPAALAAAMRTLLDDPERRAHLRRAGPERAGSFTWEASADAHVDLYTRVATRATATSR